MAGLTDEFVDRLAQRAAEAEDLRRLPDATIADFRDSGLSRLLATGRVDGAETGRNASGFLNAIYQVRSNVLFSVEYRRLLTRSLDDARRTAGHVSVSAGIGF